MSEQNLFFIDSNPDKNEAPVVTEIKVKNKSLSSTLGAKIEKKKDINKRDKKEKLLKDEKNLSNLLFGSTAKPVVESADSDSDDDLTFTNLLSAGRGAGSEGEEDDTSSSEDESESLKKKKEESESEADDSSGDDEKKPEIINEKTESKETAIDNNDGHDDSDDDSGNTSDSSDDDDKEATMLPEDTFATSLGGGVSRKRKAAWHDEADEKVLVKDVDDVVKRTEEKKVSRERYSSTVERKFKGLVGDPTWACLDKKDKEEEDSDDEFFQETTDLFDKRSKNSRLKSKTLACKMITDMNAASRHEGKNGIEGVDFHPTSTVGLVAGKSGRATIMQIDGKTNPKIQTVHFKDFPLRTAKFSTNGEEVIVGSIDRPFFYSYDMIAGKIIKVPISAQRMNGAKNTGNFVLSPDGKLIALMGKNGSIYLFAAKSKEYVGYLQMNDKCGALAFSKSGQKLYTHGYGGEVYIWDVKSRRCESKFADEGCISGRSLAVNSNFLATGSFEGAVNIYNINDISGLRNGNPKPEKTLLNLTTAINALSFNPSGEMLAFSSVSRSEVRLAHFPSMSVFENFPLTGKFHKARTVAFSPGGGYMAMGGGDKARLFRLKHYEDY